MITAPDRINLPMGWHTCRLDNGEWVEVWAGDNGVPRRIEWPPRSHTWHDIVEVGQP